MITHTGTVNTTSLIVRAAPGGIDTGKRLPSGTTVNGVGALVLAGSYSWMNITSPFVGWIASNFLKDIRTTITPDPDPIEFPGEVYLSLSPEPLAEKRKYTLVG
jgi:hypothetical protein